MRQTIYTPNTSATLDSKQPVDRTRCRVEVNSGDHRWSRYGQCHNKVKITRDGIGYCNRHDPERMKKEEAERSERHRWEMLKRIYGGAWSERDALAVAISRMKRKGDGPIAYAFNAALDKVVTYMKRKTKRERSHR